MEERRWDRGACQRHSAKPKQSRRERWVGACRPHGLHWSTGPDDRSRRARWAGPCGYIGLAKIGSPAECPRSTDARGHLLKPVRLVYPVGAELRSALKREGAQGQELHMLSWLTWIYPNRDLTREFDRITALGYLKGADLWHLANALFIASGRPGPDLPDTRQAAEGDRGPARVLDVGAPVPAEVGGSGFTARDRCDSAPGPRQDRLRASSGLGLLAGSVRLRLHQW